MPALSALKPLVHQHCLQLMAERMRLLEEGIKEAQLSAQSDTKSSAGDKHETGRAMAQIEVEKLTTALQHLRKMNTVLERMDGSTDKQRVALGAIIRTDLGTFYVSVPLGRVQVHGEDIWVISPEAPIFPALRDTPVGNVAYYSGKAYQLLELA